MLYRVRTRTDVSSVSTGFTIGGSCTPALNFFGGKEVGEMFSQFTRDPRGIAATLQRGRHGRSMGVCGACCRCSTNLICHEIPCSLSQGYCSLGAPIAIVPSHQGSCSP